MEKLKRVRNKACSKTVIKLNRSKYIRLVLFGSYIKDCFFSYADIKAILTNFSRFNNQ